MTVFAEFDTGLSNSSDLLESRTSVDIVVGYIDTAGTQSSFFDEDKDGTWRARTVFSRPRILDSEAVALRPTAVVDDNKVFLLLGSHMLRDPLGSCFAVTYRDISVVVGEVTQSTFTSRSGVIEWDAPTSPPPRISKETQAMGLEKIFGGGGSGIVMGDGTIVFPLTALLRGDSILFIIYSKEKGSTWVVAKVFFPARCFNPAPPKERGEKYS
ncbi:hypothetical protein TcYC6_0010790 [Trypanosoma cruzi]|nr:hypothetical protein TcYC6_0010790 [Trypanosoma cruzi]